MEAKLIKVLEHYHLYDGDKAIATTIVGNPMLLPNLSLKNCQAIEHGYDLDELFESIPRNLTDEKNDYWKVKAGFMEGAKAILKIFGDKKFSEEDMKSFAQNYYREIRENKSNLLWSELADKCLEEHIQSLQQTEWDVEIVMEDVYDGLDEMAQPQYSKQPKLDAENCLILKRK